MWFHVSREYLGKEITMIPRIPIAVNRSSFFLNESAEMRIVYENEDSYDDVDTLWVQSNYPELMDEVNEIIDEGIDDQIECESESHSILKFYF